MSKLTASERRILIRDAYDADTLFGVGSELASVCREGERRLSFFEHIVETDPHLVQVRKWRLAAVTAVQRTYLRDVRAGVIRCEVCEGPTRALNSYLHRGRFLVTTCDAHYCRARARAFE